MAVSCAGIRLRGTLAVAVMLLLGLVVAAPAGAIARARAERIALKVLDPGRTPGAVVVGLPGPLKASDYVFSAGVPADPIGLTTKQGRLGDELSFRERVRRIGRSAWLFWEDLEPGSDYEHPSRLLLIDARSGRVLEEQTLYFYPLLDGHVPAFVSAETNPRYAVYPKPRGRAASAQAADHAATTTSLGTFSVLPARAAAGGPFPGSCTVLIGDRHDPLRGEKTLSNFGGDMAAMAAVAKDNGIPAYNATNSENLATEVSKAIADGCTDVLIFLAGHGLPGPGTTMVDGEPVRFTYPQGAVIVNSDPLSDMAHNTTLTPEDDPEPVSVPIVTASDIAGIVKAHKEAHFKLLVDSCFAGRFEEVVRDEPNVVMFAAAAAAGEPGKRYLDTYIVNGKEETNTTPDPYHAGSWVDGFTRALEALTSSAETLLLFDGNLEGALKYAADHAKEDGDVAALSGLTHPPSFYHPVATSGGAGTTTGSTGGSSSGGSTGGTTTGGSSTPQAAFTFGPYEPPSAPKAGQAVSFDGSSSTDMGSTITDWEWTFGLPAYGGGSAGSITGASSLTAGAGFSEPGIYPVTLTVTDANGNKSDVTHAVKVSGPGKKSSAPFDIECPLSPGGTGTITIEIFIPSFAQEPKLETSFPNPICPGATQSAPILHVLAGNKEGRTDVWDESKSTFSIEVNLSNVSPPGNQKVTVPAMTVSWK